jgi:Mg2+ and Co2+ transporter CorA
VALIATYYDAEGADREISLDEVQTTALSEKDLLWIDISGADDETLQAVSQKLNVPLETFASSMPAERPQLENHGSYFRFAVDTAPTHPAHDESDNDVRLKMSQPDEGRQTVLGSVRILFIVGERWLVTIHDANVPCLDRFRDQDKADTLIGLLTGQMLAASLLDWHLGEYFQEVSRIELMVDRLDERVLRETATKTLLGRMVALRRRVSKLRALLVAQRDVFYGLSRPDFALITDSGAAPFYEALVNRFQRALDEVERSRDVVVGSFELFTSRTSQQTNDLVKVLTFLTAIVGFCAAIAGLMGMNFKLAFFETGMEGFAMVTGGLLVIAICSVAYARHRNWI